MLRGFCPCDGCTDRHLACHGSCERYSKFKKELEAVKKRREAIKKIDEYILDIAHINNYKAWELPAKKGHRGY